MTSTVLHNGAYRAGGGACMGLNRANLWCRIVDIDVVSSSWLVLFVTHDR